MIVFDTDILIDAGRGIGQARDFLRKWERGVRAISIVTKMELVVGCRNKGEVHRMERFLSHFKWLYLDERSSRKADDLLVEYRLSHGLLIADALIAATAMTRGCPLASKNQRDYRFIAGLELLAYP